MNPHEMYQKGRRRRVRQTTVHNPTRHVGRNDPCPCGSGMKFKQCCLHRDAALVGIATE